MTHQQLRKVSVVGVTVHSGPVLSHADVQSVNCGKPIDWWAKKDPTHPQNCSSESDQVAVSQHAAEGTGSRHECKN